jgi:hypothetical protein
MIFGLNSLSDGIRNALDPRHWRPMSNRHDAQGA